MRPKIEWPEGLTFQLSDYHIWRGQATQNVKTWGIQGIDTILLCMTEELGEVTKEALEMRLAIDKLAYCDRILRELQDLMALGIQLQVEVELERANLTIATPPTISTGNSS